MANVFTGNINDLVTEEEYQATKPTVGKELKKGIGRGIDLLQANAYGGLAAYADTAGANTIRNWAESGQQRNAQEAAQNPAAEGSFTALGNAYKDGGIGYGLGRTALWGAGAVGELVPQAGASIAAGAVGKRLGGELGAGALMFGQNATQEVGSIYGDILDKTGVRDGKTAIEYGLPAGAVDTATEIILLRKLLGKGIGQGSAVRDTVKAGAKQLLTEAPTEGVQTAIERAAVTSIDPDQQTFNQEGRREIVDSMAAGAIGGAVIGAGAEGTGRGLNSLVRKQEDQPVSEQPAPTPRDAIQRHVEKQVQAASAVDPSSGPLSKAVSTGLETGAVAEEAVKQAASNPAIQAINLREIQDEIQTSQEARQAVKAGQTLLDNSQQLPVENRAEELVAQAVAALPERKTKGIGNTVPQDMFSGNAGIGTAMPQTIQADDSYTRPAEQPVASGPIENRQMQNRDRTREASIAQMDNIAKNPDYDRLSEAKDPEHGAPMVYAKDDNHGNAILGKKDVVTFEDGKKVNVQYAIVDAASMQASHSVDGKPNEDYAADLPEGKFRALNNGRTAGLQEAYGRGSAKDYREKLAQNAKNLGMDIGQDDILKMPAPVLVRLYSEKENTPNIGARSNAGGGAKLSPAEQAINDGESLGNLDSLVLDDDGSININENKTIVGRFLAGLTPTELAGMKNRSGEIIPAMLQDRIAGALLARAYGDTDIIEAATESNEMRNLTQMLNILAPTISALPNDENIGVRLFVLNAVKLYRDAKRDNNNSVAQYVKQLDLTKPVPDAAVTDLAIYMEENIRAPRKMAETLMLVAKYAESAYISRGSMFGDDLPATKLAAIEYANTILLRESKDGKARTIKIGSAPATNKPDEASQAGSNDGSAAGNDTGNREQEQAAGQQAVIEQAKAPQAAAPEEFALQSYSEEDIAAKIARENNEKAAKEAALKAQIDASVDHFTLGTPQGTAGKQLRPTTSAPRDMLVPTRGSKKSEPTTGDMLTVAPDKNKDLIAPWIPILADLNETIDRFEKLGSPVKGLIEKKAVIVRDGIKKAVETGKDLLEMPPMEDALKFAENARKQVEKQEDAKAKREAAQPDLDARARAKEENLKKEGSYAKSKTSEDLVKAFDFNKAGIKYAEKMGVIFAPAMEREFETLRKTYIDAGIYDVSQAHRLEKGGESFGSLSGDWARYFEDMAAVEKQDGRTNMAQTMGRIAEFEEKRLSSQRGRIAFENERNIRNSDEPNIAAARKLLNEDYKKAVGNKVAAGKVRNAMIDLAKKTPVSDEVTVMALDMLATRLDYDGKLEFMDSNENSNDSVATKQPSSEEEKVNAVLIDGIYYNNKKKRPWIVEGNAQAAIKKLGLGGEWSVKADPNGNRGYVIGKKDKINYSRFDYWDGEYEATDKTIRYMIRPTGIDLNGDIARHFNETARDYGGIFRSGDIDSNSHGKINGGFFEFRTKEEAKDFSSHALGSDHTKIGNGAEYEEKSVGSGSQEKPSVSENTVFTEDAYLKAKELLRKKLSGSQLNSGVDPEVVLAGMAMAGYHIEKGARTFAAYSKAMIDDLGDIVKPYLKSWYMGVKYDPKAAGFDGMSSAAEVEAASVDEAPNSDSDTQPFTHSGLKVYPIRLRGATVTTKWAVQTIENAEREKNGERQIGGDEIVDTREQAIARAEEIIAKHERETKRKAEQSESDRQKEEAQKNAEESGKIPVVEAYIQAVYADNKMAAGKIRKTLSAQIREPRTGKVSSKAEWVDDRLAEGGKLTTEEEDKIKPMTRAQFNRADNREQQAHERRIKEAGKKTVYHIENSNSFWEITKTEYDYAKYTESLKKPQAEPAQATAPEHIARRNLGVKVTPQVLTNSRFQSLIGIAADSIEKLRRSDVDRVLSEAPAEYRIDLAERIKNARKDLSQEVDEALESINEEKGSSSNPAAAEEPKTKELSKDEQKAKDWAQENPDKFEAPKEELVSKPVFGGDRNSFTIERFDQESQSMKTDSFERGEYVRAMLSKDKSVNGEIDGISQTKKEASVGGVWYGFGSIYKAEKPASVEPAKVSMGSVIDAVNKKNGEGLTDADLVKPASKTPSVDRHDEVMASLNEGKLTIEEFKASFNAVTENAEAIKKELSTKTKDELLKYGGYRVRMRYANETKPHIIDAVYRGMISDYAIGGSLTYGMGKGAFEAAVRQQVEATDADKLAKYAEELAKAQEERKAKVASTMAGIENPKTIDDFRNFIKLNKAKGKTFTEARMMLNPEQRAEYDRLEAETTRESRIARKRAAKTSVKAAEQAVGGEIIATKHTKKGHDLFVVQLAERVSKDDYVTLNNSAKRLGGYYSSFRGAGAVPGFQFTDKANAEAFLKLAAGDATAAKDVAEQRRDAFEDDRSQSAAERLTEMADRLDDRADEILSADRKTNTKRRAAMAARAEGAARADKALAETMRNLAKAIEDGKAEFLDAVRQKTQVEMLEAMVKRAKDNEIRAKYENYGDQIKHQGEKPTMETADHAEFPAFTAYRSDLASLARKMLEVEGTKKIGKQLMSVADDTSDAYIAFAKDNLDRVSQFGRGDKPADFSSRDDAEIAIRRSNLVGKAIVLPVKRGQNRIILSPSEAINREIWKGDGDKRITLSKNFGMEMVQAIGRRGNRLNGLTVPWQLETAADRLKALDRLGIETPAEFRSALREFIALREQAAGPDKIKEMERAMVGRRNDGLDFFPTPEATADEMVQAADIQPGMTVLEPSAGMGHIAERIRAAGVEPDVIEMSGDRKELLEAKGFNVIATDFMDVTDRGFTYGDIFMHRDGRKGIMRGSGGLGSDRVGFIPEGKDDRYREWVNRDDLTGFLKTGYNSGYDRIIMNPPFSDRRDAEHVRHAYSLLRPGGRIVAIMGEGVFFGNDKKAQSFRDWLESVGGTDEKLSEGTFLDPSLPVNTSVNARMVVIDKPEGNSPESLNAMHRIDGQTETQAFKRWFGNSVVVDRNGDPLIVYHGSPDARFVDEDGIFKGPSERYGRGMSTDGAFWFAASKRTANTYADDRRAFDYQNADAGVIPAYIKLENPLVINGLGMHWRQAQKRGKTSDVIEEAKAKGHDGVIIRNVKDDYNNHAGTAATDTYVVFSSAQIKSAEKNNGEFDPENRDIRSRVGNIYAGISRQEAKSVIDKFVSEYKGAEKLGYKIYDTKEQAYGTSALKAKNLENQVMKGGYHRGKVHIILEGHIDAGDLLDTLRHETWAHYGFDLVQPIRKTKILKDLKKDIEGNGALKSVYDQVSRFYRDDKGSLPSDQILVEETVARIAEIYGDRIHDLAMESGLKSAIRKVLDYVAMALRSVGLMQKQDGIEQALKFLVQSARTQRSNAYTMLSEATGLQLASQKGNGKWYYSALQHAAADMIQQKGTPEQMLAMLLKQKNVKQAEIEATGLDDYLKLQGNSVTKQQIVDYLAGNGVQVQETMLGSGTKTESDKKLNALQQELKSKHGYEVGTAHGEEGEIYNEDGDLVNYDDLPEAAQKIVDEIAKLHDDAGNLVGSGAAKFAQYVLPGGNNYRELLLTMPSAEGNSFSGYVTFKKPNDVDDFLVNVQDVQGFEDLDYGRDDGDELRVHFNSFTQQNLNDLKYQSDRLGASVHTETKSGGMAFRSNHYDQPNVLAHVRFNERTDAEGKRVLFIEELQSDWAQHGRKNGFSGRMPTDEEVRRFFDLKDSADPAEYRYEMMNHPEFKNKSVPSAPFVTKTDAWVSLALKRMIAYAAENGFDRVAWTTGEQQADRYDLSKQVSRIEYEPNPSDGTYDVVVYAKEWYGVIWSNRRATESIIEDTVGKEIAKKIVSNEGDRVGGVGSDRKSISGYGLKVGGEGMKSFYDNIVPKVAKDVLKKIGGGQIDEATFFAPIDRKGEDFEALGFDITPAMREAVNGGLPLFRMTEAEQSPLYKKRSPSDVGMITKAKADEALKVDATAQKILAKGNTIKAGDLVGVRLNINVLNRTGVPVQSIHKGGEGIRKKQAAPGNQSGFYNGEVLTYLPVAVLKDAYFTVHQPMREKIASGASSKTPMASVDGEWVQTDSPSFDGVLARFNPHADHLFIDQKGRVIKYAEEATVMGHRAYLRGKIEYYEQGEAPAQSGSSPTTGKIYDQSGPEENLENIFSRREDIKSKEEIVRELKDASGGVLTDLKPSVLAAVPLMYLKDFARNDVTAVEEYIDIKRKMDKDRDSMVNQYDQRAQDWFKWHYKNREASQKMMDLMHDSTIVGQDPSEPFIPGGDNESARKAEYGRLLARYNALPEKAQEIFKGVRDDYSNQRSKLDRTIIENIIKAGEYAILKAEKEYSKEVKRIKQGGYEEAIEADLLEKAGKKYDAIVKAKQGGSVSRVRLLRTIFESGKVDAPYFPLYRDGNYFAAVYNDDGSVREYRQFKRSSEQTAFVREQKAAGNQVRYGLRSNKNDIAGAVDSGFIASVDEILAEIPESGDVRDQIYQRYLESMPDMSIRKAFIHRKKTPGYSNDALKAYGSRMFHGAYQIARLKYGIDLQETLAKIEEQAGSAKDPVNAQALANEMRLRHQWVMNPTNSKWSQKATTAAFIYYLGASPAQFLLNASQTLMMGIPILGSDASRGGFDRAASEILRASREYIKGKGDLRKILSGEELDAMNQFYDSGLIDRTQTSDLAGIGENGSGYSAARTVAMQWIGSFFQKAEVYNREVTALAAYRMARDSGLGHEKSIKEAADKTYKAHFDYTSGNRARVMQGDWPRMFLVFRQYNINMLYRLFRDIRDWAAGESPEIRRQARRQLGAMMGMYTVMTGVTGVPFYGLLMMLGKLGDDDDEDFEQDFKKGVIDFLGPKIGRYVLNGPVGTELNIDLSSRIGMANLWFRDQDSQLEGKDAYWAFVQQTLGAVPSIGANIMTGAKLIADGNIERGIEAAMPTAIRGLMRGARYFMDEKATTMAGDTLTDTGYWESIAQAMGFTPANVAEQYETNAAIRNASARIRDHRREVLNQYALAVKTGENVKESISQIQEFNKENPRMAITAKTIQQSLKSRAKRQAITKNGLYVDKKTAALRDEMYLEQ